jgi:2-polyprenyl-6-methoxyphenol hydroxylase-like FAD-dependent oxidoreductase
LDEEARIPIEVETIGILASMGMLDAVRARALPPRGFEFKDADDNTIGVLGGQATPDESVNEKYEIHREDLLAILFASVEGSAEVVFGQSIKQLEDGPNDVVVTLWGVTKTTAAAPLIFSLHARV